MNAVQPFIAVENLSMSFRRHGSFFGRLSGEPVQLIRALNGVSFTVARGETLGIVGESGCGKSTLARCLVRLLTPQGGRIVYDGLDVLSLEEAKQQAYSRRVQMVFQDPYSSLNPRMTVGQMLAEAIRFHGLRQGAGVEQRISELLYLVRLPADATVRYPYEFSGGQRQRIGIARALAVEPKLIICDEPVSALDVSIQAQIINLLEDLQQKFGLAYLFIAHDLSVVEHISRRVAVMYLGRIVETAPARELYTSPKHPYTEALLSAVPIPDPKVKRQRIRLQGEVPSPIHPPSGCHFHTRCPIARFPLCSSQTPALKQGADGHWVACHLR